MSIDRYPHKSDLSYCCSHYFHSIYSPLSINIAASLGVLGKRVLVVDMDPQGNTTSGFGISKKNTAATVYDVLIGRTEIKDAILVTPFENLSVLPSNISLASGI